MYTCAPVCICTCVCVCLCICVCNSVIDWCCFYYFVRNSLVALLEALCACLNHNTLPTAQLCSVWLCENCFCACQLRYLVHKLYKSQLHYGCAYVCLKCASHCLLIFIWCLLMPPSASSVPDASRASSGAPWCLPSLEWFLSVPPTLQRMPPDVSKVPIFHARFRRE